MAINDTLNLNSSFDYFKLYNDDNITLSSTATATTATNLPLLSSSTTTTATTTIPSYVVTSPSSTSTQPPSTSTIANNASIIPLATATTLTITSTIINNNYTSHSHSNYNNSNTNTNHSSNNYTINSFNQSTYDQLRNLSGNGSDDNNLNLNDSAKIAYESGSNFMLLLEDFGEYFYNVNGSDYNSTISIYQNNCTLTNSSCSDINERKFISTVYKYLSNLNLNFEIVYFHFNLNLNPICFLTTICAISMRIIIIKKIKYLLSQAPKLVKQDKNNTLNKTSKVSFNYMEIKNYTSISFIHQDLNTVLKKRS